MPIPKTREELVDSLHETFEKLQAELEALPEQADGYLCVDDWTIRDLICVRLWWSRAVLSWIKAGQRGKQPATPAPGFKWSQTPALNEQIIRETDLGLPKINRDLKRTFKSILKVIGDLDDAELLAVGVFEWAGKHPISRWVSLNTTRQYTTARTLIRRAVREHAES